MQGQLDKDTCLCSGTLRCVKTDYFECAYLACLGMKVRYQDSVYMFASLPRTSIYSPGQLKKKKDSVYNSYHIKLLNKNNIQQFYFCHGVDQINSFFSVNILSYTYILF